MVDVARKNSAASLATVMVARRVSPILYIRSGAIAALKVGGVLSTARVVVAGAA